MQPHTAREVGKSHGPTTLPAIVEGRALPSGTRHTRPTQVSTLAVTRLWLDPAWGRLWGRRNHKGQPVKGTLKALWQIISGADQVASCKNLQMVRQRKPNQLLGGGLAQPTMSGGRQAHLPMAGPVHTPRGPQGRSVGAW